MALTEMSVRKAAPREKTYQLTDGGGLALWVYPSGAKSWRLRYWENGKEKKRTLGEYPLFSLKEAREWRDEARKALALGKVPFADKKPVQKDFGAWAEEWWAGHRKTLRSDKNIKTMDARLRSYILPALGAKDPAAITPAELADFVKLLGSTGRLETAHRVRDMLRQIFRYIFEAHAIEHNPVYELRGILPQRHAVHHPSITEPAGIAVLRDNIRAFHGTVTIKAALLFSLYTFARPGEIRHCEWGEIDLQAAEWHIPAEKMKAGVKHIVPLSRQAIEAIEMMRPLSFAFGRYVFPAPRCYDGSRPYCDGAINQAFVRCMGYEKHEMTSHGFRSMASTRLNESGLWGYDAIEAQLAHSSADRVRGAYNYARYMQERRRMMQWWADYIDGLSAN